MPTRFGYMIRHTMQQDPAHLFVPLYATAPYPCSYLEGREARSQVVAVLGEAVSPSLFSRLVAGGFRRSGQFIYRPWCDGCRQCVPVRIDSQSFSLSRSQRRTFLRNQHLRLREVPRDTPNEEHYRLFLRYQRSRHPGGGMDEDSIEQYAQFILDSPVDSRLLEFRDPGDGALRIVSLVDLTEDGISAVYTFYDPDRPRDGLGTWAILRQVHLCTQLGLRYLYLGYWIANSPKMSYKSGFAALQYFYANRWHSSPPPPCPPPTT